MSFLDRFRKPTQQKFADLLVASLRSSGDTRSWQYDESFNRLVPATGSREAPANVINLHNMFREYAEAKPAQRKDILKRQAGGMLPLAIPAHFADAHARLRPVIRSATERGMTYLQLRTGASHFDIAFRPVHDNLEIGIAYDGESTIVRLTETKLKEWNVTFDEVYQIAVDNLRLESSKPFVPIGNGVLVSEFGDHYDASRLLLTDLLHRQTISGAPVVMAPNRSVLLLTGDRNTAGFGAMLELAEQALAQPRALPPLMLRWDGAAWQRFAPEGHESKLRQLRIREVSADYQDQLAHLNDIHVQEAIDIFVAQYTVVQRSSGEMLTVCVWTEGVHTFLPVTDIVALFRQEPKQCAYVPWSELVKECGQLMKPTGHLPVRYEVKAFPEDERFRSWCVKYDKV